MVIRTHVRTRPGGLQETAPLARTTGIGGCPNQVVGIRCGKRNDYPPPARTGLLNAVVRPGYCELAQALPTWALFPRSTITWRVACPRPRESVQVSVQLSLAPVSMRGRGDSKLTLAPIQSSGAR